MFEVFSTLINRLIDYARHKATRDLRLLTEIITPMMDELLVIHKDYIKMFESTKSILEQDSKGNKTALQDALVYLKKRRLAGEAAREKLLSASRVLSQCSDLPQKYSGFLDLIANYFESAIPGDTTIAMSLVTALERYIRSAEKEGQSKRHPCRHGFDDPFSALEEALRQIRGRFSKICEEHAKLKIQVL
jgi:hypothetical protein